jgi:hypothetical protein
MDDTTGTLEESSSLQKAAAHHNEWEAQNIKISVNESPDNDELVDIDLAQCLGHNNNRSRPSHSRASDPSFSRTVRDFM